MSRRFYGSLRAPLFFLAGALALGCEARTHPQIIDSQTNWLKACQIDAQCGDYSCVCGVCTSPCGDDSACSSLKGSSCVDASDPGGIAECGGTRVPKLGICLPRCDDGGCASGQMCVAGVCAPVPTPDTQVTIDTQVKHQTLTGFGASVAYSEAQITSHPRKAALYAAVFAGLGLDVLRMRDRYGHAGDDDLTSAVELVTAAQASLGRAPTLFMTSWSPPPALKVNGAVNCSGNPDTCTLTKTAGGAFDYAGFATFMRQSLDAYAAVGIAPDYVGIQNNPDWLPSSAELGEACVFLPVEGSATMVVNGASVVVSYPGYAEAQAATVKALAGLASPPKILAPETSDGASVADYIAVLGDGTFDAIAHHLYGTNPQAADLTELSGLGKLATDAGVPVFQTEMQADGLGTAMLIHDTTVVEGAAAYLQQTLTTSSTGPAANTQALVAVGPNNFTLQDPYYAVQHYALHTEPGWVRVDAASSSPSVLASAWLSPSGDALTIVLVNPGSSAIDAKVNLPAGSPSGTSSVSRSVFGGVERGADLGKLSAEGILSVPPRSVVTVALSD